MESQVRQERQALIETFDAHVQGQTAGLFGQRHEYPVLRGEGAAPKRQVGGLIVNQGTIVATRWSATDSTYYSTSDHPVAIGGVQ